jgi:ABC-type enterochelin transport system permease subunit
MKYESTEEEVGLFTRIYNRLSHYLGLKSFIAFIYKFFPLIILSYLSIVLYFCFFLKSEQYTIYSLILTILIFSVITYIISYLTKQITTEEIFESLEREIFDKLEKIASNQKRIENKLNKILDLLYDEEEQDIPDTRTSFIRELDAPRI